MWLINAVSLELENVVDHESVRYAILSHTWEEEEVLMHDMHDLAAARQKKGFSKIEATCRLARARNLSYAWIDTCCIDKTSSAELSEAINSMFQWYKNADVCIVHLSDLSGDSISTFQAVWDKLPDCRWFSRGWTLQELIAPREVHFYDRDWLKSWPKEMLAARISTITTIPLSVLTHAKTLDSISIARRMSWAANRHTTRPEDLAYSLLGIFDIHMPMLYGEGRKAFLRLQEEICRRSKDLTLFAWEAPKTNLSKYHGLFARHPHDFACASNLESDATRMPYTNEIRLTNKGICLDDTELALNKEHGVYLSLGCCRGDTPGVAHICLVKTLEGYVRADADKLVYALPLPVQWLPPQDIYIPAFLNSFDLEKLFHQTSHRISIVVDDPQRLAIGATLPFDFWDPYLSAFLVSEIINFFSMEELTNNSYFINSRNASYMALKDRLLTRAMKIGCTANGIGDYYGIVELSISGVSRYLIFELGGDPDRMTMTPGRRLSLMKHKIVNDHMKPWMHQLVMAEKSKKMSGKTKRAIHRELTAFGNAVEGEGLFSWGLESNSDPERMPKLKVEVKNTTKEVGQAWVFTLSR